MLAVYHLVKMSYYSIFYELIILYIICTIWNNAHLRKPTSHKPENNGWVLENDQYHFKWFEGDQLPTYVSDSLQTLSEADEDDDIHEDKSAEWSSGDEDNRDTDEDDEVD
ncbi:uncharacterized protein LOC129237994 [Anastrepha obliqua]|uniref:uncharacterized protein LOC129237994 n=1 Tax=Anastrepha obliqua TaxID=95512 RepID=UPI002409ECD6|nr:uncharacterized protein LOC129237994 [Anastrepha obliqua]